MLGGPRDRGSHGSETRRPVCEHGLLYEELYCVLVLCTVLFIELYFACS